MHMLSFLTAPASKAVLFSLPFDVSVPVAPGTAAVLCGAFWAIVVILITRSGAPRSTYLLLVSYAFAATIANAYAARFHNAQISPHLSWTIGLFAGAGMAAHIASPVLTWYAPPHKLFRPTGPLVLIFLPLLGVPLIFLSRHLVVGILVCGSALSGLWALLYLMNAGLCAGTRLGRSASSIAAVALVIPEFTAIILTALLLDTKYSALSTFPHLNF